MRKTLVFGRPGKHSSYLSRVHGFKALAAAVTALVLAAVTISNVTSIGGPLVFIGAGASLGCVAYAYDAYGKAQKARIGTVAEKLTLRGLKRARAFCVVNGALIGAGGDLDHVVFHRAVFALETKSGRAQVFSNKYGTALNSKTRDQVVRQARTLSKILNTPVHSVIVVPYLKHQRTVLIDGVIVCNAAGLSQVLERTGPFNQSTARANGEKLWKSAKAAGSAAPSAETRRQLQENFR